MGDLPLRTKVTAKTAESNDLVTTFSSTVNKIPNWGKTLLTSTAAKGYILEAPIPGVRKVIVQTTTSTVIRTVTGPTTTVFFANATATNTTLSFDTLGDLIELEGRTTLIWDVISNPTSVSLS
jgi:hypothetical protein